MKTNLAGQKEDGRWERIWKLILGCVVVALFGGCATANSTGHSGRFLEEKSPQYFCYAQASVLVPMFIPIPDKYVPKRATLRVQLDDLTGGYLHEKVVLKHEARLRVSPRDIRISSTLVGDVFTVTVKPWNETSRQTWTLQYRRGTDGMFRLTERHGDFLE